MKRISLKYWQILRPFEQQFINERANRNDIPSLKLMIKEARRQQPDFYAIYGNGFIDTPSGKFMFSGEDTRRYIPIS